MSVNAEKKSKATPFRILYVEDDESIRGLMRIVFKKTDYLFEMAENGAIGLEMYKKGNYDLVLMDLKMPVMDGLEATKEIREWEKQEGKKRVPLIALTAHGTTNDKKKSEDAGCDDHLIKPIKKQDLMNLIGKYLSSWQP